MKQFFSKLSIRRKVILFITGVAAGALFVSSALITYFHIRSLRDQFADVTRTFAATMIRPTSVALQLGDPTSLQSTLEENKTIFHLESICVLDKNKMLFAASPKNCDPHPALALSPTEDRFSGDSLEILEPVTNRSKTDGFIYIKASTHELNAQRNHHLVLFSLFTGLGLGLAAIFASNLQKNIFQPILDLALKARNIPESVDYPIQVDSQDDEIESLHFGFQKMLRKIERREEQRNRAEAALVESEKRYRNLVETTPDAIFLQKNDSIVYLNPASFKLLGLQSELELAGLNIQKFFADTEVLPPNGKVFETQLIRKDGKKIDVNGIFIDTFYQGEAAIQGILRDVREAKQLREAAQQMKQLAAMGELSAQVAHEIRNSIGSLQLNIRYLSEHKDSPEAQENAISAMHLAIQRMEQSVVDILNFAKPAAPTLKLIPITVILESSLKAEEKALREHEIEIYRNYDESLPDVEVDPYQLQQVFVNLIRNSRQAMPCGGTLTIATALHNGCIEVRISDTGEGISTENLDNVFRPFFSTKTEGTGLGLAIVTRTLALHHGQILVEQNVGQGVTFSVVLPLNQLNWSSV